MSKKSFLPFVVLTVLFLLTITIAIIFGSIRIPLNKIISALLTLGGDKVEQVIIWQIRIPRLILGIFVGAGLAVCGAVFQSILRNPLASPYTLGISGGSALGATLGIILGASGFYFPLFAFLGGILSVLLIYIIASSRRFSNSALILTGVILSFTFSSLVLLLFSVSKSERVHSALLWLIGDLSSSQDILVTILPFIVISGIIILVLFGRDINILTLGQEKAMYLGVEAKYVRKILFIVSSFIVAACVAASGIISFVGLIIPHFMRYFFGLNHRKLLCACALCGAIFLVLCDLVARIVIRPLELPVGVITGFFGGIFFLTFLIKSKEWEVI